MFMGFYPASLQSIFDLFLSINTSSNVVVRSLHGLAAFEFGSRLGMDTSWVRVGHAPRLVLPPRKLVGWLRQSKTENVPAGAHLAVCLGSSKPHVLSDRSK